MTNKSNKQTQTKKSEVAEVEKVFAPIKQTKLGQHARNVHCAYVDKFMTIAQLENPKLWALVGARLQVGDCLEVQARNGSMIAFGLVRFAQSSIVKVKFYEQYDLDEVKQAEINYEGYIIRLVSPMEGWEIINEDSTILKSGIPDQNAAMTYLQDHLKANAA
jgi:hypothetical protein